MDEFTKFLCDLRRDVDEIKDNISKQQVNFTMSVSIDNEKFFEELASAILKSVKLEKRQ